ncbi:MAG: hypothetical protein DSZ24_06575, partial [Thermodesulfatator sp.]
LELDPENAEAMAGLASSLLKLRQNEEALDWALQAVGLRYHFPLAHFTIGVVLHRLGYLREALKALEVAVHQNPNFVEAYQRLAYIYERRLGRRDKALEYKRRAQEARRNLRRLKKEGIGVLDEETRAKVALTSDLLPEKEAEGAGVFDPRRTVVIVSGLPRSGTSLMMQMLEAGGLEVLTDHERPPDESNPRGYYEYAKAKNLKKDASWLEEARGKAVKIVVPALFHLPLERDLSYRVIFMLRNLEEVIRSQEKMLKRQGKKAGERSRMQKALLTYLQQSIKFLDLAGIPALFVDYHRILQDPLREAERIKRFLGRDLEVEKMIRVVDPSLYRERHGEPPGGESASPSRTLRRAL